MHFYKIEIAIEAPFLSGRSGNSPFGIDVWQITNKHNQPVFPSTLLKGNLREVLHRVGVAKDKVDLLYGKEYLDEHACPLISFDNEFTLQAPTGAKYELRTRNRNADDEGNRTSGLLVVTQPLVSGNRYNTLTFNAHCVVRLPDTDQAELAVKDLKSTIEKVYSLARNKGVGYGKVLDCEISGSDAYGDAAPGWEKLAEEVSTDSSSGSNEVEIKLTPAWNFCFQAPGSSGNEIKTLHHIPGSAIKANIAKEVKAVSPEPVNPNIQALLDNMVITHAYHGSAANGAIPDSLYITEGTVKNTFTEPAEQQSTPVKFKPDWKDSDKDLVNDSLSLSDKVKVVNHVKQAHNIETRATKNEALYSIESVLVDHRDPDYKPIWVAKIILPENTNHNVIKEFVELCNKSNNLASGWLSSIGKLKTPCQISLTTDLSNKGTQGVELKSVEQNQQATLQLSLSSDAELLQLEQLQELNLCDTSLLMTLYQEAFQARLIDPASRIEILDMCTTESLERQKNHWHNHSGSDSVQSVLVTNAGSAFKVQVNAAALLELEQNWHRYGIPSIDQDSAPAHYETETHLRENGYAQISLEAL